MSQSESQNTRDAVVPSSEKPASSINGPSTDSPVTNGKPHSKPLAIVLAAGKGTRMESELPKVLVPIHGRPMIWYVIETLRAGGIEKIIVVVGYRSELVRQELRDQADVTFVEQTEQLGTGHAVMMCRETLKEHTGGVLIVTGDSPMLQQSSIAALLSEYEASQPACIVGTTTATDPFGLGRVIRDENNTFLKIVEQKDASPAEAAVTEVNMSTYLFTCQDLLRSLDQITTSNAQAEYYVTDCPGILKAAGKQVLAANVLQPCESLSINSMKHLAIVEAEMTRLGMVPAK